MKYWEFLIQKEGDQTWLPLETQQVEILEGRYRVVAHTDRANTEMNIVVSQLITDETPPRKRVRKRTSQTNDSGLVVVMPYVHLKSGQWELTCSGNSAVDGLIGNGWQYSVQLQVFAPTDEDWSAEWPVPADFDAAASVVAEDEPADTASDLVNQDLPLVQAQAALETHLQAGANDGPVLSTAGASSSTAAPMSYLVALRQQAYLAQQNQPMTIVGRVTSLSEAVHEETSQLWIRLQNPQTAQVIMEAHRPLSLARLPADFKVQIQLPAEVTTRVILGEVSLRTAAIAPGDEVRVLASTAFTITAGIAQLLDAIATQDPGTLTGAFEEEMLPMPTSIRSSSSGNSTGPSFTVPLSDPTQKRTVPAIGVVPQLDSETPQFAPAGLDLLGTQSGSEPATEPALPSFIESDVSANLTVSDRPSETIERPPEAEMETLEEIEASPVSASPPPSAALPERFVERRVPMVSQPAQFLGTSIEDSDLEADEIAAVLEDIDQDLRSEASDLDALEPPGIEGALPNSRANSRVNGQAAASRMNAPDNSAFSEPSNSRATDKNFASTDTGNGRQNLSQPNQRVAADLDFQSLRLKDHFWNRLSSLTRESHKEATQIAKGMREAGVSRGRSFLPAVPAFSQDSEVVIYDETPATSQPTAFATNSTVADLPAPTRPNPPSQEDLPEMALPVISVPLGDFVAGEMISVTVRTRPSTYKPFIKLWMIDRQSRSLVIEPQLLTSLKPDALGDLQATTELKVPMDCLDVQIAAIAVDMATQQESNKAIVNRHVVPAGHPASTSGFSF